MKTKIKPKLERVTPEVEYTFADHRRAVNRQRLRG
jgi:hypothetical protein